LKTGISYFGVRNPELVKVDMHQIKDLGYTHVLHTVSEEDLEYYFDSMRKIIEITRRYGLTVYVNPWGVGRVFGGEGYSEIAARNPSSAQYSNCEMRLGASCPNSKAFRDYMLKWIDFVCSTEVETVFWDEPHFYYCKEYKHIATKSPEGREISDQQKRFEAHSNSLFWQGENPKLWACRCEECQRKFRKQYNHTMPAGLSETVIKFRQNSLLEFLDFVTQAVRKRGKRNCVCLLPHEINSGISDWEAIAQLDAVDELATNPYWTNESRISDVSDHYHKYSREILHLARKYNKEAQIWIKNFQVRKNSEDFIGAAAWAAYNEGIRNLFAWAYKGCEYHSLLRCDEPETVWETQTMVFEEIQRKAALERGNKIIFT
jgi:hypothetical protein